MNILQITSNMCAPMSANDNNGINRVVTALSQHFVNAYHYTCHNAYYQDNPQGQSTVFTKGIQLCIPLDMEELRNYLIKNLINVIVINVSDAAYVREIPTISEIARACNIKVIYCIHFMPGYEAYSYTTLSMTLYNIIHNVKIMDSLKKYLMTISRPYSFKLIWKLLRDQYLQPLETSDKVVVFTHPYIQQYLRVAHSDHYDKFAIIPNPLPFPLYSTTNEIVHKEKMVIIVGRLYEYNKRLSYALRVWQMVEQNPVLKDWKLTIIGEGISRGYYEWLSHKYNLKNVEFVGSKDPTPYYKRASILLSTSAYEGWPMVLMECMPMGVVPCVFNSYGAATDIIDHNVNGIVAPDNDLNAFYMDLSGLMLNDTKRFQMAEATIEKSKTFDMNIIGKRWKSLLESC